MPRTRINSKSKDLVKDNGSVLLSVIDGEQIHFDITCGWLTNMTGYTITAKIVEADSSAVDHANGALPTEIQSGGQVVTLPIIDADASDNTFKIVIPEDLAASFTTQPLPEKPSYGWIGLEVADTGIGNAQQIWKPMRGLVEILYSPSEA